MCIKISLKGDSFCKTNEAIKRTPGLLDYILMQHLQRICTVAFNSRTQCRLGIYLQKKCFVGTNNEIHGDTVIGKLKIVLEKPGFSSVLPQASYIVITKLIIVKIGINLLYQGRKVHSVKIYC